MADIGFALVLSLHQPPGNLEHLLDEQEQEAREILWAIDRIPRSLWRYEDLATRPPLALREPCSRRSRAPTSSIASTASSIAGRCCGTCRTPRVIELLGTGYYHPVLPLIRPIDRDEHLDRWRTIAGHLFARDRFPGFWPPELGFSMDLVPTLAATATAT